ncbi:Protease prsW family protein [Candidatus Bilamarchaeum dharawalense]|uniref:Protease prsW family protein n=1 Tax=Candidatus Bilamarchaeum dharawalense TaxID=2885759 RepID=A0A5E4LS59_9ARCH|nr:Protease prsW family protein [Candidatus Bilamarchaeum dharawalense]
MLEVVNRFFIGFLMIFALLGIIVSIAILGLGIIVGPETIDGIEKMEHPTDLSMEESVIQTYSEDSPYQLNITIHTPPITETSLLTLRIYGNGKSLNEADCLEDFSDPSEYVGLTEFNCLALIPYTYEKQGDYKIFAVLDDESSSNPISFHLDWTNYEKHFWDFSTTVFFLLIGVYVAIIVPVALMVLNIARTTKHKLSFPGEFTLHSLIHPFVNTSSLLQKFYSFIVSPYFWAFELIGIILILSYMVVDAQAWKSTSALTGFVLSGMAAFIIPFLWCAAWWYADFKEREPIRVLITLFFWGMLSALMAIGINTLAGALFGIIGLGFLSTFLVAPIVEETYKGSGLALLSEYHDYDSIEDGIVYGFVIGMGFAFIENWIYFLDTPMGSDVWGWLVLFILRSIVFSANHGFYTAVTGAIIAFFIARKFKAPGLGILIGMPVAALFHAMHNSSSILTALLGGGGLLLYCCLLIPIFDYGGFFILLLLFLRAVFTKKEPDGIPAVGESLKKPEIRASVNRKP